LIRFPVTAVPVATEKHCYLAEDTAGVQYILKCSQRTDHCMEQWYRTESKLLSADTAPPNALYPRHYGYFQNAVVNGVTYRHTMVMEYIRGKCLSESSPVSEREAAKHLLSLIACLEQTNALGFFHLDIQLSNVVIDSLGQARLVDYTGAFAKAHYEKTAVHSRLRYRVQEGWSPEWLQLQQLVLLFNEHLLGQESSLREQLWSKSALAEKLPSAQPMLLADVLRCFS